MLRNDSLILCFIGFLIVGCIIAVAFHLSGDARLRRRRRKSHTRIISKARHPTVKFSVKVPEEK